MLASCQISEEIVPVSGKVYKAVLEGQTRTAMAVSADAIKVNWVAGDKIAVTDGANTAIYRTDVSGVTKANFYYESGTDPFELPTAYYPADIKTALPSIYKFNAAVPSEMPVPMVGSILDDEIVFKNLVGLLKINATTTIADVKVKSLTVSSEKPMAGPYTVKDNAAEIAAESQSTSITIDCGEGVALGATPVTFYVPVPAAEYGALVIKLTTVDGKTQTLKAKSSIKIERSKFYEADFAFNKLEAVALGGKAILPEGPDFNTFIKQLIDPLADSTSVETSVVKKIVFDNNSANSVGQEIQPLDSEKPIYLSLDEGSGTVTVSTPAAEFLLVGNGNHMFRDFSALEEIVNLKSVNTEECTSMLHMFSMYGSDTSALTSVDLSGFNTQNVVTFRSMFNKSWIKELDLTNFNTKSVETMAYMFSGSKLEKVDVSGWTNDSCEDFQYMFNSTSKMKEIKIDNFNTENATTMLYMFASSTVEGLDLSSFITENVSDFGNMFYHCYNVQYIRGTENFDTSAGTLFRSMFNRCDSCTELNCSGYDLSSATNAWYMFYKCVNLQKLNLEGMDITNVLSTNLQYFMPRSQSLRELHLGEDFIPADAPKIPNAFTMYYADAEDESTGCQSPTGIAIYCSQDVAEYMVTTDFQYPCNGWQYQGKIHQPVNVKWYDYKTGREMNITVPPNAVEAYRL